MSERVVLLIEDNPATRKMVRFALENAKFTVIEAENGKQAIALAEKHKPIVVLQDLILPDMDGEELLSALRRVAGDSTMHVLAFSGFTSKFEQAKISSLGFDDIIIKPIEPSRLIPIVATFFPTSGSDEKRFGEGRTLVLADDDPLQRKLARLRLGKYGFDIRDAADGVEALEKARQQPPDIIVADVMMPRLDGFGLALSARQDPALANTPIILVTSSYLEATDRDLAKKAGANELVLRTPELGELVAVLRATLAEGRKPQGPVPEQSPELQGERMRRGFQQLERQVSQNANLARRCTSLAAELAVLTAISDVVLQGKDLGPTLDEVLAACLDVGGISVGALYLFDDSNELSVRPIGERRANPHLRTFFGKPEILRDIIAKRELVKLPSSKIDASATKELLALAEASAAVVVPLANRERALGALFMVARDNQELDEEWCLFVQGVGNQISTTLTLAHTFSERAIAEREAQASRAEWRALVEHAPDLISKVDRQGIVRFVNHVPPSETAGAALGASWAKDPVTKHQEAKEKALRSVFETGKPTAVELSGESADGEKVWYSSHIGPITNGEEIIGAVVVSRDITRKTQTEAQLIVADRMASIGTLAAGVAHEINNPLACVMLNLDLASRQMQQFAAKGLPVSDTSDALRDAHEATVRVREIVRDLKIFSRSDEAEQRAYVDVRRVLESTLRMAWNEIRHRARIVKEYEDVPLVEANESRLGQVFLNLILNAAQAIREGDADNNEVKITAYTDAKGRVVVAVRDTGSGITPEVRKRLFTPFMTTKPVGVGTGLGLSICHRIVTAINGEILVDSEVGKGTEFRVVLPAVAAGIKATSAPAKALVQPARRRARVLVVDDEVLVTRVVRRTLAAEHDVTTLQSAQEALDLIEVGERFDVILCDVMMPQLTGMDLFETLTEKVPEQAAKMVFATGGAFTPRTREFLDHVPNRRIDKPFDAPTLRALINEMLL